MGQCNSQPAAEKDPGDKAGPSAGRAPCMFLFDMVTNSFLRVQLITVTYFPGTLESC